MRCYYEVLDIAQTATADDVKKAYRKQALRWHPDKNYDNQVEATERMAAVSQAYDVLSNPQEKAWYDAHRDAILSGVHPSAVGTDAGRPQDASAGITSQELFGFFTTSCFEGYGDNLSGFYAVYRRIFERIASEESTADPVQPVLPSFGASGTPYLPNETSRIDVQKFYSRWLQFSTNKSFAWRDAYRLSDVRSVAPHIIIIAHGTYLKYI